jgi:hypothetical protein
LLLLLAAELFRLTVSASLWSMECAESDSDLATDLASLCAEPSSSDPRIVDESSSLSPDWKAPRDAEFSDMSAKLLVAADADATDLTLFRDATDFWLSLDSERGCSGSFSTTSWLLFVDLADLGFKI